MKKCPFCAEEIQEDAIKCKHCNEFLEKKPQGKWFFRPSWMVLAFLSVGPLALPLIWFHPRLPRAGKIVITAVVLVATYFLGILTVNSLKEINKYYQTISQGQGFGL